MLTNADAWLRLRWPAQGGNGWGWAGGLVPAGISGLVGLERGSLILPVVAEGPEVVCLRGLETMAYAIASIYSSFVVADQNTEAHRKCGGFLRAGRRLP